MKTKNTLHCIVHSCSMYFSELNSKSRISRQKRLTTSLLLLLISNVIFSQGSQTNIQVPVSAGGYFLRWALLYKPDDYATTTTKYPLLVFLHGKGEQGTCICPGDLPLIYNNSGAGGPAYFISQNQWPTSFLNPADGQNYKFIVLSPQAENGWSTSGSSLEHIIKFMVQNYRVDTNRIYVTGLSAGGEGITDYTEHNGFIPTYALAAFVPMSAVNSPTHALAANVVSDSARAWGFGDPNNDAHGANTKRLIDSINWVKTGYARFTSYNGGHCCWNTFYNPAWNDPVTGLSIYQWMLTHVQNQLPLLPVIFISFTVKKEDNSARLTWKVGTEENVSRYEIEKSINGKEFITIGFVNASAQDQYSFTDGLILDKCFYRIKSVDYDGKYKYSSIVSFNQGKTSIVLKVFPIPVQKETIIQHPVSINNSMISIASEDGKTIKEIRIMPGTQQTSMNLSSLTSGLYFISYNDGLGNTETIKFIKH